MKLIATLLLAAAAPQMTDTRYAVDEAMAPPEAKPVWADEFEGQAVDARSWSFDTSRNREGWYNDEKQYYGPDNARVADGRLLIEARAGAPRGKADWGGQGYSSGKLFTKGKRAWTYGFFEVRAKLPCARGTWPAIWLMPEEGKWPDAGEIDVMEQVGWDPEVIHGTLHTALFVHSKGTQRGAQTRLADACGAWHRYQLDWRPDRITIGVDGRAFMRVANDQPGGRGAWPFDTPFHLILNVAVGGGWGGAKGIDDAALPQRMEVDYVRVWKPVTPPAR
jgi:beta-glucanase (GH16 family)